MDMNSSNGTRLNGERLRPNQQYPLQNGSIIAIVDQVVLEFNTEMKNASEPIIKTEPAPPSSERTATGLRPAFSQSQDETDPQDKTTRQTANWESLDEPSSDIGEDWDPFKRD